mgnify:CR=1 FL=1
MTVCGARSDIAKIPFQGAFGQFGDGAGHFDSGRPAADDNEGQQALPQLGIGRDLGALEGHENLGADRRCVLDLLEAGREGFPAFVAIGMARSGGDDEVVIGKPHIVQNDGLRARVDVLNRPQDCPRIGLTAQHAADRAGDIGRRQPCRGDLVEERLEQVIVAPIDDGDVGRATRERPRGAQASESRTEDNDARAIRFGLARPAVG